MHATIRPTHMFLFYLIFLLRTTIRPRVRVLTVFFFYLYTTIRQKYMVLSHLIFIFYTTIRPKIRVFIDLFLSCAHEHSIEMGGFLIFIIIIFFVHDHSIKT